MIRAASGSRVERFDAAADVALEPLRSTTWSRAVFVGASHAADFSALWVGIGAVYGLGVRRDLAQAATFCGLILAESIVVNQGIKRVFRRVRPTEAGDVRLRVRRPRTSSFPSGHASSAFFAGTLLSAWVGWETAPVWLVPATTVALSRAVVRIHHMSDVAAGVVVGLGLAALALASPAAPVLRR